MKFVITSTSNELSNSKPKYTEKKYLEGKKWYIEINTIEEIIKLSKETGRELIINTDEEPYIEIYDCFRE